MLCIVEIAKNSDKMTDNKTTKAQQEPAKDKAESAITPSHRVCIAPMLDWIHKLYKYFIYNSLKIFIFYLSKI